jgi:hypothetical protein
MNPVDELEPTGVRLLIDEPVRDDPTSTLEEEEEGEEEESRNRAQHEVPSEDHDLTQGINEQMNLFWGAVSSAFAGPLGDGNHHPQPPPPLPHHDDQHEDHLQHPQVGPGGEHMDVDNDGQVKEISTEHEVEQPNPLVSPRQDDPTESLPTTQTNDSHHVSDDLSTNIEVDEGSSNHPRNQWEHVQLLMSLGGQLGQDLSVLNNDGLATTSEVDPRFGEVVHGEELVVDDQSPRKADETDPQQGSRSRVKPVTRGRTRRSKVQEEVEDHNAEAGPSNSPGTAAGEGMPEDHPSEPLTRKRGRAIRSTINANETTTTTTATTTTEPNPTSPGTPTPKPPAKPVRKPRRSANQPTNSSGGSSAPGRALLSAAERRANHVSSEKRRRNAIRIGYAELGALEHMSVNIPWPPMGELDAVIEESKDMEGMEELTGRKRARVDELDVPTVGEQGGLEGVEMVDHLNGTGLVDEVDVGSSVLPTTSMITAMTTAPTRGRNRKGIYVVGHGTTSKSAILRKAASLAQWLTDGNEWLRSEVERLEILLGVEPDQILEEDDDDEPEEAERGTHQVEGLDRGFFGNDDGVAGQGGGDEEGIEHHHEHGHEHELEHALSLVPGPHLDPDHDIHDRHHEQNDDGRSHPENDLLIPSDSHHINIDQHDHHDHHRDHDHHTEETTTTIEEHFVRAVQALRPNTEELGPDGYPRDMY